MLDNWPGPEDIAHFRERGWVVSPKLLDDSLVEDAEGAAEAYYAGERDHQLPLRGGFLDWRPGDGEGLRLNDYVSLQSEGLRALATAPAIGRAAGALLGVRTVGIFHDQLVGKPPGPARVGWHTDRSYWATCTSETMVTAWVPLRDCPEASGPLAVVDGSHLWPDTDWMATFRSDDSGELAVRLGRSLTPRVLELTRGQVSFHHARTIHGSLSNRAERIRVALAVHLQDGGNRYRPATDASGRRVVHVNDALCRRGADGLPDYQDPGVCPRIWSGDP